MYIMKIVKFYPSIIHKKENNNNILHYMYDTCILPVSNNYKLMINHKFTIQTNTKE